MVTAIALMAAISMVLPAPVAAAGRLSLDPAEGTDGRTVDAIGAGYPPDSSILVLWDGQVVKSVTSPTAASFKVAFRVPGNATYGPHTVTMCVAGSGPDGCGVERADATFRVTSGATPTPSPSPAPADQSGQAGTAAGPSLDPMPALVAALVIGAAAAVLILVRKRRVAAAARRAAEPGAWRRRRAT